MDKKTLDIIKKKLLDQRKELQERVEWFAKEDEDRKGNYKTLFPNYGTKDDENAAEVATFSDRISMEHTLELEMSDINKALASIEKGTYGTCKYCKQSIEEKRLLVRPTSSSCVACKKRLKGEAM